MSKLFNVLLTACLLVTSVAVFAADLQQVKGQGQIGEQLNGYLGLIDADAASDVHELVKEINNKRKVKYQSIAAQNSTSLETVELLAGKKAIERTAEGNYIQTATGWKKK